MKKPSLYLILIIILSSCWGETSSSSTIFSFDSFDYFKKTEGQKTILEQYVLHRQFSKTIVGNFEGPLLNPLNYPEDETLDPHYRDETAVAGDLNEESITFASQNNQLLNHINSLANKKLNDEEMNDLLAILDQNDEFINQQNLFYYDRHLSEDLDEGSYYAFNNYFRTETSIVRRYDNHIIQGEGQGTLLYQDGFDVTFTFQTQIFATSSTIYQLRDETFPEGIRTARDSKASSLRVTGNFQQALILGGGGQAKRFIETYASYYQPTDGSMDPNQYAYTLRAEKKDDYTKMVFYVYRPSKGLFDTQTIQDMTLTYEVFIQEGVVTDIVARQTLYQG